ncbi:hypothetical protein BH23ACT5_BH23ACT5_02080 [soil metagenome]
MKLSPHNDWRGLAPDPSAGDRLTAAVVIPVYNRPDLLQRTLAGLERSTRLPAVIVADDGSEADIAAVVAASSLDVTLVSQEHDGNGAARARNLGADAAGDVDVVVFIDADCIPHPELIRRHLAWQAAAPSLVTVGSRSHVRASHLSPADIAAGVADLESATATGFSGRPDFRRLLARRSSGLTMGDEAFRTFVSSNVAVRRDLFLEVGGFADRFSRWGSEDTELGWRLWQAGAFFVPLEDALVHHQIDEDEEGGHAGRRRARVLNDGSLSTLVPHGFYRKPRRDVIYEVPKVSLVVNDPPADLDDLWTDVTGQTAPDWELILVGCQELHEPMAGLLGGDPRVSLTDTVVPGLAAAQGELVVTVDGAVALDHRFLARVVKHFHDRPTTSSLTVGYTLPSDPLEVFRTQDDASGVDHRWGGDIPLVTVTRRREWAKAGLSDVGVSWEAIRKLERADHLAQGLAWIPATEAVDRPPGFVANRPTRAAMAADLRSRPRDAARTAAKILRSRSRGIPYSIPTARRPTTAEPSPEGPVHARYVGWVGKDNLGDDAMLEAFRRLMPWASVEVSGMPRDLLLLGGGTLINRSTYLGWLTERDSPRVERAVLGTGVASPEFWGETEPVDGWLRWLSSCAYVGVRGPNSVETLREWGFEGPLEVCGDSALLFERPADVPVVDGLVVISPAWTGGELWGGSDEAVMEALAGSAQRWLADGRPVAFLSCNPVDDRPIFETMRALGRPDLTYLAGYRDLEAALTMLASAELVVAERLHAAVLAAAVGTPFVSLEYRPKLADFAASVGATGALVRADEVHPDQIERAARTAADITPIVNEHVATFRSRLRAATEVIRSAVEAGR